MSNSVVPAAAAAQAKQLVRNKKLIKRAEDQRPARDEQQATDKDDDAVHAVQAKHADDHQVSMSDTSLSADFSFSGALSAAAESTALAESAAQEESGSVGDDGDGAGGTVLLVGAVGLAGLGVAVLAGGGGSKNEAPVFTSGTTATIAENSAITTAVYTAVATDADGDAITYSLSGTDAALFAISSTGVVTLKAPADFETKTSYAITVNASDGDETVSQNVAVTVTNVADAPTFTSGTTGTIAENAAATTVVYDANVTGTGTVFSLTGTDAAFFTIDADDGEVRFKTSPDFEAAGHAATYAIGVVATQGTFAATQNVSVSVTNVAESQPISSAATATVAENTPTSTVVYNADVTGTAPVTFGITGTDAALFTIDADDGEVRFKASPDFESTHGAAYNFTVTANTGGEVATKAVVLTVTDVNPEGPTFTSAATSAIAENTPITTVAYDADVTSSGTTTFSLAGTDASLFTINATNGQVFFKASPDFEAAHGPAYNITINATDTVGTTAQSVVINVTDINPEVVSVSLDVGNPTNQITLNDAAGGPRVFTDVFGQSGNVVLTGFTNDDVIQVTGGAASEYSFTTGDGTNGDANDLVIQYNSGGSPLVTQTIIIKDAVANDILFSSYSSPSGNDALHAVGYTFMTFA